MKIYMTSDLHVDHYGEENISVADFTENALLGADVLCVAGDTSDDPEVFLDFYKTVSPKYKKIFIVFGNHDLTVHNTTYFKCNPFTETQAKLDYLKAELSKLGNVSVLDGNVEEYGGVTFGGTMAFNDWTYAFHLEPEPDGDIYTFLGRWHYWYDYQHWNYKKNVHRDILADEMKKLDYVVAQKPDIIMTHYIPLFFGVEREYLYSDSTTYFYFNGEKFVDKLKNGSIWLAGHTHSVRQKELERADGSVVHLKINPVGYPDECEKNRERRGEFVLEIKEQL